MAGCWPRFVLCVHGPRLRLGPQTRKKTELGQYLAILTSHLVNNPYLLHSCRPNFRPAECGTCGKLRLIGSVCYTGYLWREAFQKQKQTSCSLESDSELEKSSNAKRKYYK